MTLASKLCNYNNLKLVPGYRAGADKDFGICLGTLGAYVGEASQCTLGSGTGLGGWCMGGVGMLSRARWRDGGR